VLEPFLAVPRCVVHRDAINVGKVLYGNVLLSNVNRMLYGFVAALILRYLRYLANM
jgi:hypothetical protein